MVDVIVQGIKAVWEGNEAKAALTGRKGKSKGTESQVSFKKIANLYIFLNEKEL